MRQLGWSLALTFPLVVLGCTEPRAVEPVAPKANLWPTPASTPAEPEPVTLNVTATAFELDGRARVEVRPTHAPGVVDVELRPSYAYPQLREVTSEAPPERLVVDAAASVGAVRGALASVPEGARIELALPEGRSLAVRGAARGDAPLLRVIGARVELRDATGVLAQAELAQAATLLTRLHRPAAVAVELGDERLGHELLALAEVAARAGVGELILALDHAPCVPAPAGMSCVPGGFAIVGSDEHPEERPQREVEISTFYIDQHEITNADYDACHAAGACRRRINGEQNIMKPFVGPTQPVVPLDWERAVRYCAWAGKRLPSEWEWEKAARGPEGSRYPWGDEPPSCDRAQYRECAPRGCEPYPGKAHPWDCNEHDTKPVGSYPAGHYGLFEMAGNGYEWTATVGVEDLRDCGAECEGRDPLGPCQGAQPCGKNNTRVLKGGSWYWPAERIRGAHRRVEKTNSGGHRLSARCATALPFLTRFPSAAIERPRPPLPEPSPPSAEQLAIFTGITRDPIESKPICSDAVRETWGVQARGGRSETTCRDPFSYVMSNEPKAYLWKPFLADIGGGYLGVASDQNFSFVAVARSEWVWLMDYDPRVYDHHQRLRALILTAQTPEEFIALWSEDGVKRAIEAIGAHTADPEDLPRLRSGYYAQREKVHAYFEEQLRVDRRRDDGFGWLANPEHYAYIRTLYQQGRILPIAGDLLGQHGMRSIGEAARALGVAIRVFYTSNAPISWGGQLTDAYRANVLALPFDARSIVLQTTEAGGFRQAGHWHYNVQWGPHMHDKLRKPGYATVASMLFERIPGGHGDLTVVGLPSGVTGL